MGIKTKLAKGPNPLSMMTTKRDASKAIMKDKKRQRRRPRKGKRSRELSLMKKQQESGELHDKVDVTIV